MRDGAAPEPSSQVSVIFVTVVVSGVVCKPQAGRQFGLRFEEGEVHIMKRVDAHSVGLAFGAFLGLWHTFWALLVLVGAAQWLLDFIFRLHMIAPPYHVTAFNLITAVSLVLVTALVGYIGGFVIGIIWNRCARETKTA